MKKALCASLRQAILSRAFLISTLGAAFIPLLSSVQGILAGFRSAELLSPGYHSDLIMGALSSDAMALALPILAALPYTASFIDDVKSGFIKEYLPRTTVPRYIAGKAVGCAVSGGLALTLGIFIAYGFAALMFLPMEAYPKAGETVPNYFGNLMETALMFFASGAFWSLTGMTFAALTDSKYMAYASPFVLFYLLIILYERYFDKLFVLYPREWLSPSPRWVFGKIGVAVLLIEFSLLMAIAFAYAAKRRLETKQIFAVTRYNFRRWHKKPRIVITFCLAFVLCFLLSDKAVKFAKEYDTTMQLVEAFVWTFGDSNSILLSSLLLLLLFADMPFISSATPFYLMRIDRKTWLTGQAAYIALATLIYLAFILISTSLVCMRQSFVGDMWSETAAILGYS